jgi:hypothetical protein
MFTLDQHRRANALIAARDPALLIVVATLQQLPVERGQIGRLRHGYPVIPSKVPGLAFHAAFLVALCRSAELTVLPPYDWNFHDLSKTAKQLTLSCFFCTLLT